MANDPQWNSPPDGWTTYFHTTDVKATLDRALAAGAVTRGSVEPMEVKDKGVMGLMADPTGGAFFGLWQPTGHRGFELVNEHGAPVYFQLSTRGYTAAQDFYCTVFGWQLETVSDTDEFRYSTALFGGEALLGLMDGTRDLPRGGCRRTGSSSSAPTTWTRACSRSSITAQRDPRRRGHPLWAAGRGRRPDGGGRVQPVLAAVTVRPS